MKHTGLSNMSKIAMLIVIPSPVLFSLHHSSYRPRDKKFEEYNAIKLLYFTNRRGLELLLRSEIGVRTVFNIIVTNLIVTLVY